MPNANALALDPRDLIAPIPNVQTAPHIRRRRLLLRLAKTLLLGSLGTYASRVEPDNIAVADIDAHVAGWPSSAAGLRIGHISDVHCDYERAAKRAGYAARLLLAQKPDIVVLTGDYTTHQPYGWARACAEELAPLAKVPGGAYAVLGNHDWWTGDPDHIIEEFERVGITVLRNDARPVPNAKGVWVVGLDDCALGKDDTALALARVPENAHKLLLVHEPDYADQSPPGFSLQFSGHSHGGQVRIPGLPPLFSPSLGHRYPEGLRQGPHHLVYTTRGVGMVGPQIRLFCRPEVALVSIFPKSA